MTKDEIISRIEAENPCINDIKLWIKTMNFKKSVTFLKKGDVIAYQLYKSRPVVIIKVKHNENLAYGIPLSTTEDELNLCSYVSRQFGMGFLGKSIICLKENLCLNDFIGTFDNNYCLNKAISMLKEIFSTF
jgi:hypothetical protein